MLNNVMIAVNSFQQEYITKMVKHILIYIIGLLIVIAGNLYATDTPLPSPMTLEQINTIENNIRSIQQHIANIEMSTKERYLSLTPEENYMIMEFRYDIDMLEFRLKLNQKKLNQIEKYKRGAGSE